MKKNTNKDSSANNGQKNLPEHRDVPFPLIKRSLQVMRSIIGKWKIEILWALLPGHQQGAGPQGQLRFGELRRLIPGITQHMLTAQLRELEADGLIKRTAYAEIPPRVEYEVTQATLALSPVFFALIDWCQHHEALLVSREPETVELPPAQPAPK
jgi:DNA-binding HxlR family transcriptional regulator